jgi:hypothetical protein
MKFLSFALLLFAALESSACMVSPAIQNVPHDKFIERSNTIVLAKAAKSEVMTNGEVRYFFEVKNTIAGNAAKNFEVIGFPEMVSGDLNHFNHHNDKQFWKTSRGRMVHDTDCQIHPSFALGREYLLFLDVPYHNKSFELIVNGSGDLRKKDKWLQYVEGKIKARQAMKPTDAKKK